MASAGKTAVVHNVADVCRDHLEPSLLKQVVHFPTRDKVLELTRGRSYLNQVACFFIDQCSSQKMGRHLRILFRAARQIRNRPDGA